MKKTIFIVFLAVLSGGILGKITIDKYDKFDVQNTIKLDTNVYALKYNSYEDKTSMKNDIIDISRYIYIQKDNKYNVYVAIAKTKNSINKLKNIFSKDFKIEKINISNDEFIQNLDEYEKLLNVASDNQTLNTIENEILSCYEKLVVNNE